MVKIRLKRVGAKKRPSYRLVVADTRSPRGGRFIESLGFYDPLPDPARITIDADRVRDWMRRGAQPTDTARSLLQKEGILAPTPRPVRPHASAPDGDAGNAPGAAAASSGSGEVEAAGGVREQAEKESGDGSEADAGREARAKE